MTGLRKAIEELANDYAHSAKFYAAWPDHAEHVGRSKAYSEAEARLRTVLATHPAELRDPRLPDRFWAKIDVDPWSGCWLWNARCDSYGYGYFRWQESMRAAHRLAYEMLVGPVPDGLHLDHLCRTPRCCNPSHLEPVTPAENNRRGFSPSAVNGRKTHCKHGHPFDEANTYTLPNGRRVCRTCQRANAARAWEKKKAVLAAAREAGALPPRPSDDEGQAAR